MSAQEKSSPAAQTTPPRHSDQVHLQWLRDFGVGSFKGMRVLDLGCGSGFISDLARIEGAQLSVGVDIEIPAEGAVAPNTWTFIQANLDLDNWLNEIPAKNFDLILAFDILEHLRSPVVFLEQCRSLLSEKGTLFLTTPNTQSLEKMLRPATWSGATDPQHRILFTRYSLGFLLSKTGLKPIHIDAPMKSLKWLPRWIQPQIGGQLLVQARPG